MTPAQQAALQEAIIKTSQNPVGNIAIIPFQNNFNYGVGPYTRFQYNLNIQPVVPFMLSKDMTLIARTIIPIINQPSFAPPPVCASQYGCGSTFGLSDIQEQFFFAPKTKPGALIWGVGPIFQVPSASPGTLGAGKWAAGPNVVGLIMPGNIVAGILASQLWSFAGQVNRPNINAALFQPFFNFNLKGGWAISTAPIITANWTATQNKWAVPLGGGVARTFKLGDQLMSLSMLYYTYVSRPITTPQTNLKVVWSLLYPIKRGIDVQELIKENQ
ncbi:MAG: neuromedin U [Candidatus Cybelea sp.]